jgi:hypothetical protein
MKSQIPPLPPGQIKTFPLTPPDHPPSAGGIKKGGDRGDRGINPLLDRRSFADRSPESSLIIAFHELLHQSQVPQT